MVIDIKQRTGDSRPVRCTDVIMNTAGSAPMDQNNRFVPTQHIPLSTYQQNVSWS